MYIYIPLGACSKNHTYCTNGAIAATVAAAAILPTT